MSKKRGPAPETLKLPGNREQNVRKLIRKARPEGGWPAAPKPAKKKPKTK